MRRWRADSAGWDDWQRQMDDLFERLMAPAPRRWVHDPEDWTPPLDLSETSEAYVIQMEVPGLEPDRISLTLQGAALVIAGEKPHERHCEGECFHRIERRYGPFRRVVPLPGEVDRARISASARNGVLTVRIPKREALKPVPIEINVLREGPGEAGG